MNRKHQSAFPGLEETPDTGLNLRVGQCGCLAKKCCKKYKKPGKKRCKKCPKR